MSLPNLHDINGNPVSIFDTRGDVVTGVPSTPPVTLPPVAPPTGPARNIAAWCSGINLGKGVGNRDSTIVTTSHRLAVDVIDPTFEWVQTAGFIGQDNGGTFSVYASVNGGPAVPVTIGGKDIWRLEKPTGLRVVTSDPVKMEARAGDTLNVTVWTDADGAGGSIPSSFTGAVQGRDPGPIFGGWALRPSRIVAPSTVPAWVALGDSICQQDNSFPQQALGERGVPFTVGARGGDAYMYHAAALGDHQSAHLGHASRVLDEMGINDAGHAGSPPEMDRDNARRAWLQYRDTGVDVLIKTTLTPSAASTDGYATLSGQTPNYESGRAAFQAWLRDGAPLSADKTIALTPGATDVGALRCDVVLPDGSVKKGTGGHPVTAVSDVAAAVEEGTTGKWAIGMPAAAYGDGLHPGPAAHAKLAERLARDLQALGF